MIDILHQIESMRLKRSWSENELCRRANLSQSTVNTWYRKQQIPSLHSLEKISDALGISLSMLVAEEDNLTEVTKEEVNFLQLFHQLTPTQQEAFLGFLQAMLPEY